MTKKPKIVPAPFPQEHLRAANRIDNENWEELSRIVHPHGDAIELDIINGEFVELAVKQGGLHEVCCLGFTGPQLDVLIGRLQTARQKMKP